MSRLRSARPEVDPNTGFLAQLRRLEARLRGSPGPKAGDVAVCDEAGTGAVAEVTAGPIGESMEELKRAALARMAELFQRRGIFVGDVSGPGGARVSTRGEMAEP